MKKILVTGASGFLGSALMTQLVDNVEFTPLAALRRDYSQLSAKVKSVVVGDLHASTDWEQALFEVDVVIHTAARVHVMNDSVSNPLTEFRRVNFEGTMALARQAAESNVKRFIFISSIKVNGEMTADEVPFLPNDKFVPDDPYALSKYETEQGLLALAEETGLEVVIIRPPLVYGPGVRANFASMISWVQKGVPLPFGAIHNQRSLVALDNLVSFIVHCIGHPKAANEIFLISDNKDVSTTELLQNVAMAFGKKARLVPIPAGLMSFAAKLVGKGDMADRLFGSLQIDSSKARELLSWEPVTTMGEQLKKTADAYLNEKAL